MQHGSCQPQRGWERTDSRRSAMATRASPSRTQRFCFPISSWNAIKNNFGLFWLRIEKSNCRQLAAWSSSGRSQLVCHQSSGARRLTSCVSKELCPECLMCRTH